jgi:hypothetical protein
MLVYLPLEDLIHLTKPTSLHATSTKNIKIQKNNHMYKERHVTQKKLKPIRAYAR